MAKPLLPLCSIPKVATRDGWGGATAHLLLPFYDTYWFASGQIYNFPTATIAQNTANTLFGTSKPDTFVKAPGICIPG